MKRVLVVGDLHAGSLVSPMGGTRTVDGTTIGPNHIQRYLDRRWRRMCRDVGHVDLVVANGDLCDGVNYKSGGLGLWTSSMEAQVDCAADLLGRIDADRYLGTNGSPYHVGSNACYDALVLKQLGGECADEQVVNVDGVRMYFRHKIGVSSSSWQYRTTPVAKEMLMSVLNEAEFGKFDVLCFSHAHYFTYAGFGTSLGMICPCWKGRDQFAKQRSLAMMPHLGYVLFECEAGRYRWRFDTFALKGKRIIEEVTV